MADRDPMGGRKQHEARPLGDNQGVVSRSPTIRTGRKEARSAGPDGPDATQITRSIRPRGAKDPVRP